MKTSVPAAPSASSPPEHGIVDTLHTQHRALEELAQQVEASLEARDVAALGTQLLRLREALLKHIALEDSQFYPELLERVKEQPSQLMVAQLFSNNMRLLSNGLTSFFERYVRGPQPLDAFARDWRHVKGLLSQRIRDEEHTLYPLHTRPPRRR